MVAATGPFSKDCVEYKKVAATGFKAASFTIVCGVVPPSITCKAGKPDLNSSSDATDY